MGRAQGRVIGCAPMMSPECGGRPESLVVETVDECVEDCAAAEPSGPPELEPSTPSSVTAGPQPAVISTQERQ
jgi:hypothetical protein